MSLLLLPDDSLEKANKYKIRVFSILVVRILSNEDRFGELIKVTFLRPLPKCGEVEQGGEVEKVRNFRFVAN
ncbi:MAG: hypothetical protein ACE5K2_02040 [Candidatus Zixiibacteriota bacterium]